MAAQPGTGVYVISSVLAVVLWCRERDSVHAFIPSKSFSHEQRPVKSFQLAYLLTFTLTVTKVLKVTQTHRVIDPLQLVKNL